MIANCDKCGELVPPNNNAVYWEVEYTGNSFLLLFAQSRHLRAADNGCPGSPSRQHMIMTDDKAYEAHQRIQEPGYEGPR